MQQNDALRSAIFLDFDNVVSGLATGAGPDVAYRFASDPEPWFDWLTQDAPRRVLLRRCYMNPAGYLLDEQGNRSYFSAFRRAFQALGFEVVDCPPLTRMKNGADLRMALDVMDALVATTRFDEFILMSTDSDFVPLLLRLRAADRRTKLVAHPDVGRVVRAAADHVVGLDALARGLGWEATPREEALFGQDAGEQVLAAVADIMAEAQGPLPLAALGAQVRTRTGMTLRESDWAGTGSIDALVAKVGGIVRQEGPAGGFLVRQEWMLPAPEAEPPTA
jgi:hypothetical protein